MRSRHQLFLCSLCVFPDLKSISEQAMHEKGFQCALPLLAAEDAPESRIVTGCSQHIESEVIFTFSGNYAAFIQRAPIFLRYGYGSAWELYTKLQSTLTDFCSENREPRIEKPKHLPNRIPAHHLLLDLYASPVLDLHGASP